MNQIIRYVTCVLPQQQQQQQQQLLLLLHSFALLFLAQVKHQSSWLETKHLSPWPALANEIDLSR